MSARRESLRRRLEIIDSDGLRCGLDGCPTGGWPETKQAMERLEDSLPRARAYRVHDVVDACYRVDAAGRYRWARA